MTVHIIKTRASPKHSGSFWTPLPPKKLVLCLNISLLVIPRWNILLNIVGILSCDIGVLEVEEKVLKDFNLQYTMYYHYTQSILVEKLHDKKLSSSLSLLVYKELWFHLKRECKHHKMHLKFSIFVGQCSISLWWAQSFTLQFPKNSFKTPPECI